MLPSHNPQKDSYLRFFERVEVRQRQPRGPVFGARPLSWNQRGGPTRRMFNPFMRALVGQTIDFCRLSTCRGTPLPFFHASTQRTILHKADRRFSCPGSAASQPGLSLRPDRVLFPFALIRVHLPSRHTAPDGLGSFRQPLPAPAHSRLTAQFCTMRIAGARHRTTCHHAPPPDLASFRRLTHPRLISQNKAFGTLNLPPANIVVEERQCA